MKTLKLEFKDDQMGTAINKINTILLMLSEGKFKDTFHIIQEIQVQINKQLAEKPENQETEEPEDVQVMVK